MFVSKKNKKRMNKIFKKALKLGIDFKLNNKVKNKDFIINKDLTDKICFSNSSKDMIKILNDFKNEILPYCTNFSNVNFMSFPDSGNSIAGITAAILSDFLQQNLINNSFCAPIATHMEIEVINCLRKFIGYDIKTIGNIWDVGGIITYGGTGSNTVALMLARENHRNVTMQNGEISPKDFITILPKDIGHYSIKSGAMWLGLGSNVIEVDTIDFKYDIKKLKETILKNKGKVMCVVVYVGDSRTMTIDNLEEVYKIVKMIDPNIWLHADACHGFCLGFSEKYKHKIKGLENYDSVSTDPHKVFALPYCISALLVKKPEHFKLIKSTSDLIMKEDYAFGQITPFIGSKSWISLKLWFFIQNLGFEGIEKMINERIKMANKLKEKIENSPNFILLNNVEINSVVFMYAPKQLNNDVYKLNEINILLHKKMEEEGVFHLHQFSLPDDKGVVEKKATLYPLRYMSGNPNIREKDLDKLLKYIEKLGENLVNE